MPHIVTDEAETAYPSCGTEFTSGI